jgi:hypothetical protein
LLISRDLSKVKLATEPAQEKLLMNTFQLYGTWYSRLAQTIPDSCPSRRKNLSWLIVGLYLGMSVHLSAIVRKWPMPAKNRSLTKRVERFLANPAVRVRDWYEPVAQQLLLPFAGGEVRLIIDGSKVGHGHQLLMVTLAQGRRALPLAWTWIKGARGHSSAETQVAVLKYVQGVLPPRTRVLLVGDAEFGSIAVLRQLRRWRWGYVLRQKSNHLVRQKGRRQWQTLGSLVQKPHQQVWWPEAFLTAEWKYPTALLAYWAKGEEEPWLLATNLPDVRHTRQAYHRRMWIEEMFGDMKGHGVDLEATRLQHFLHLSRLMLAVALLYVWLMHTGQRAIKLGQRHLVDRHDRRDLSLFRIGWDLTEKQLALQQSVLVAFHPLVSGG